jgi:hypothetical protein
MKHEAEDQVKRDRGDAAAQNLRCSRYDNHRTEMTL